VNVPPHQRRAISIGGHLLRPRQLLVATGLVLAVGLVPGAEEGAIEPPEIEGLVEVNELIATGDLEGAESLARELLARTETAHGPDSAEVAAVLDVISKVFWNQVDIFRNEPREFAERALAIKEQIYGPDHLEVATSLMYLAVILGNQGDWEGGQALAERALAIRQHLLGPDHRLVGNTLRSLGIGLSAVDPPAAQEALERAAAIHTKTDGPESELVGGDRWMLAFLLETTGDYAAARAPYETALGIYGRVMGEEDPFQGPGHAVTVRRRFVFF
jgi:tetratricopeptide (TPR) repeat protein